MPAINEITRSKIKDYLEAFIDRVIEDNRQRVGTKFENPQTYLRLKSRKPSLKPFHAAVIPDEFLLISEFERSFSTILGTTFEECARLIAHDHHAEVIRSYEISGWISDHALQEVENQVLWFHRAKDRQTEHQDRASYVPDLDEMIAAVLKARDSAGQSLRSTRTDLYIRTHDDIEYFLEIKSPQPNKDQCFRMLQRILHNHVIRGLPRPRVQSYFAMAYNPYGGTRADYRWSVAQLYLPFEQATLIGDEFWRVIGGETTYEEVLEIYAEVGHDKRKYMLDSLHP